MSEFAATIPGLPPSVNHSYRIIRAKTGAMTLAKTANAESYQTGVAYIVKLAKPSGWTATRRIQIIYRFWFNTENRDASNAIKLLEDGIAAGLGVNDKTFVPCVELKEVDKLNPRVEIIVRTIDE
jgi:Holliday junction resolvase RusA-like endonuclease